MGVGPIPWISINEWARRYKVYGDEFTRLVHIIRGMDAVYMKKQNTEKKKSIKKKGRGSFSKPTAIGSK